MKYIKKTPPDDVSGGIFRPARIRAPNRHPALRLGLGLAQTQTAVAFLPLATGLEEVDALETLEDVALGRDLSRSLETTMLTHFFFSCSKIELVV